MLPRGEGEGGWEMGRVEDGGTKECETSEGREWWEGVMGMRRLEWFIDGIYHMFLRRLAYSLRRCRLSMFSLYLALRLSHTHKSTTNQSLPKHERQWLSSDPAQERILTTTHSDIHIEYHIQIPIKIKSASQHPRPNL